MLTKKEEDTASGKPNTKARPFRFYSCSWKKWIDIETQRSHDDKCYEVSKTITRLQTLNQTCKNRFQQRTPVSIWSTLITFCQTEHMLVPMLCCLSLKTMKTWLKKLAKGRSPTVRHVSRNHRVALDWLCDRIILDSIIQIRYIDTKHQLADILTKGNFTRDEWNNLHQWFNMSHFSSLCCAKNSSLTSCPKTMAKRMQEPKEMKVWRNRNLQRWSSLHMFRQVPHPQKVRFRWNS